MINLKKFAFSEKWRNIITYLIYVVFVGYSIHLIIEAPELSVKLTYGAITIIFMSICILSEYLRILYRNSIKALNLKCDPITSREINAKILKFDLFKSYTQTLKIMETLLLIDENKAEECLTFLEDNEKLFKQNLDYLLIRNYSAFKAYFMIDNKSKVKKFYPEVTKLKGAKIKGSKVSPLYSWEEIDAVYYLSSKDYKKSRNAFESAHLGNMNSRELSHFYYEFALLAIAEGKSVEAIKHLDAVIEMSNKMTLFEIAKQLRKDLTDEKA